MADFGWNYPPGVTGNEPQITGEWPCELCDGAGGERDPDGGNHHATCPRCKGTGIDPEELVCPAGHASDPDARECEKCGASLEHLWEW